MRVLFLGREDKPTLRFLRSSGEDVVATAERIDLARVRDLGVDAIVSHDYGHLVHGEVLASVGLAVNLHVSLLPWNRGTHPNLWSFVDDTPKGVTIHHMDTGVDTGDVVARREVAFRADETTLATTHARLQEEIAGLFAEVWPSLREGTAPRVPQTWNGTYHRDADLELVRPLLVDGWETSVAALAGAGRRLREASPARTSVLIRCDGSPTIGAGHVTRCRSLATALRERGTAVRFAMRAEGGAGLEQAAADGFEVLALPGSASEPGLDEVDLEALLEAAERLAVDCVLVDHYGADERYLAAIAESGRALAVVDDRADRDLRAVSWLLNQNLAAARLDYRLSERCVRLLGAEFALLRPQFREARARLERRFAASDRSVLLTLGGGDTEAEAAAALAALDAAPGPLAVRVVVAGRAPLGSAIADAAAASPHEVVVLRDVADMASEMERADVSLNAGGSTCWELMCLGVPMVVTSLSADQKLNPEPLAEAGAAVAVERGDWRAAAAAVAELIAAPDRREAMSRRARRLVDGDGARRAAASLETALVRAREEAVGARG